MKIQHREDYRALRAKKYPAIGNQLDAVMKMAQSLKAQGITLPEETNKWIEDCSAVKSLYKKPVNP